MGAYEDAMNQVIASRQATENRTKQSVNNFSAVMQMLGQAQQAQQMGQPQIQHAAPVDKSGGGSFQQFINSIAKQESGGNYHAVNKSSGAAGKYQIMPSNIPSWSKAALGHSVSLSEFMNNPQIQEQIAQYKLREYYDRYGAEGAAKAWYGGPGAVNSNGNKSQGAYPTINNYANQILGRM